MRQMVMLKDIMNYDGIYLACGITDLRRAVDGLAIIVKQEFNMDPLKTIFTCSVTGPAIASKHLAGIAMDSYFTTRD